MAVLHRALFSWFIALVFIILLALRLDSKVPWNWFIIFTPLWIFDAIISFYLLFKLISHYRNGYDSTDLSIKRKIWFLIALFLKLTFQVLLCIRQEYFPAKIELYYVMIPIWILLIGSIGDVFTSLTW
ncbi:transmembrane protein 60-like [Tubulanus polymorphus]|uniref:transmembrane protein 60-like n=1 Tax=Tubulanus polymorphus TaxID=672921 RepID=UPI003DA52957